MHIDIKVRESEHGKTIYKGNGDAVQVLAAVIAKFGLRGRVFSDVLDYECEEMVP